MKYKAYFFVFLVTFLIFFFDITSYAAEKELSVNLSKDAGAAIFCFDFDDEQTYEIAITRPNGETSSQSITGATGTVSILDPKAGKYSILITAEDEISVSARVEIKNSTSATLAESGVTISSSISGLSLYFIDGDIAGEWNNTNLGKVNITVTNPKNMQVLHSTTVEGNSFLLGLPNDVQEIEVYIVPASSAKVNGAGVTYTLPVVRNLDAEVHLPENNLTNIDTALINVVLGDVFCIEVVENKITVYEEELPAGEHEIEFPLNSIDNAITLYIRDQNRNTATYSCKIHKDVIAPTINLSGTYDNIQTSNEEIEISGTVIDADFLYINGEEAEMASNGKFTISSLLKEGDNEIILCAKDLAGNESIVKIRVERIIQKFPTYTMAGAAIFVIFLLIGVFLYKKRVQMASSLKEESENMQKEKKGHILRKKQKDKDKTTIISDQTVIKRLKRKRNAINLVKVFNTVIAVASIYIFTHICFFETYVASGSMEPTLKTGSIVLYNKLYYLTRNYNRGDIVCLWSDTYDNYIAKRIIGLPGDKIEFHDGALFINGCICQEDYIAEGVETNSLKSFIVPEGHVFILGDNRENSVDSRYWSDPYVNMDNIVGKYFGSIANPLVE